MTGDSAVPVAVVRQRLPAPPEVVFDEWTDAARLAEWMCPRPARCLSVTVDARVGGRLRLEVEDDGATFLVSGSYLSVDRPRRLSFTWSCSTWPDPAAQSVVTVTIEPDGPAASVMTIEHALLPSGLTGQHERGWLLIARQLAAALPARAGYERDERDPASRQPGCHVASSGLRSTTRSRGR